jgi:putative oxidoreductase
MLRRIFSTSNDPTLLITRLILGIIFFAHGAQKALGWFGGSGMEQTIEMFGAMGVPVPLAVLATAAEFLGGLGLILGFFGRIAAAGVAVNMVVAIFAVHLPHGLFMNWSGAQAGEGFEFHLLAIAAAIVVLVHGSGLLSIDAAIDRGIMEDSNRTGFGRKAA